METGKQQPESHQSNMNGKTVHAIIVPILSILIILIIAIIEVKVRPPPDYSCFAVSMLIFCIWPLGQLAVRKSRETNEYIALGKMSAAH